MFPQMRLHPSERSKRHRGGTPLGRATSLQGPGSRMLSVQSSRIWQKSATSKTPPAPEGRRPGGSTPWSGHSMSSSWTWAGRTDQRPARSPGLVEIPTNRTLLGGSSKGRGGKTVATQYKDLFVPGRRGPTAWVHELFQRRRRGAWRAPGGSRGVPAIPAHRSQSHRGSRSSVG